MATKLKVPANCRRRRDISTNADRPIVVAGEALIDLLIYEDGSIEASHGGGPFNAVRTVARLGEPAVFLGMLSDDAFGRGLRSSLVSDGVHVADGLSTHLPTTLALAEIDSTGAANYRFCAGGTSAPSLTECSTAAVPTNPHSLHVGTLGLVFEPTASTLLGLMRKMKGRALISLDPNCRPSAIPDLGHYRARMAAAVGVSDLVKLSDEDAEVLAPDADPARTARTLLEQGPQLVVLTHGQDGAQAFGEGWEFHVPAPLIDVVDTVGAGDSFAGALLTSLRRMGRSVDDLGDQDIVRRAVDLAVMVSAVVCGRKGAEPPFLRELGAPPTVL